MTITPAQKELQNFARARAGRIREGMRNYIATLGEIYAAWNDGDWTVLGYTSWQEYVDTEFGADRVRLPAEQRKKAVEELRLSGMSTRAIGQTLGVNRSTVQKDLQVGGIHPPEEITGADGKTYPARSPIAEAMEQAIEDASERAQTHEPAAGHPPAPAASTPDGPPSDADLHAELDAEMAGTAVRFRAQFSAAVARADDVWQFDVDRIAEVYAADFDQELAPFIGEMRAWCDRVERTHRRLNSGLRVVGS